MKRRIIKWLLASIGLLTLACLALLMPVSHHPQSDEEIIIMQFDYIISAALFKFRVDTGNYPTTEEGLTALHKKTKNKYWAGPYIENEETIEDIWNRKLGYVYPGIHNKESYDLYSLGKDGVLSEDDITNWK